ncbi:DUF397 domain-containing protein [Salinactinospora qingdaonensis]|uniref:DUF397 domain-containing protein n=1 Tax=Salinactinospora qingdaonensis TaxID=702744 RepID=A0ABP7G7F0_9ACTN
MAALEMADTGWRTSSYSGTAGGQCVEFAHLQSGVAVRDSTDREGLILAFSHLAWIAFVLVAVSGGV